MSKLLKSCLAHVLYPIFQKKSIENGLKYVSGLKVMLIDVDKVNQAESTSGYVMFQKTHMTHVLYPIFQEKSIGNSLRYVRCFKVMLNDVNNVNLAESRKWIRKPAYKTYAMHVFEKLTYLLVNSAWLMSTSMSKT